MTWKFNILKHVNENRKKIEKIVLLGKKFTFLTTTWLYEGKSQYPLQASVATLHIARQAELQYQRQNLKTNRPLSLYCSAHHPSFLAGAGWSYLHLIGLLDFLPSIRLYISPGLWHDLIFWLDFCTNSMHSIAPWQNSPHRHKRGCIGMFQLCNKSCSIQLCNKSCSIQLCNKSCSIQLPPFKDRGGCWDEIW